MSKNGKIDLVGSFSSETPEATEFRRLATKLKSANEGKEIKNLLVTSATAGEGKSTTAACLAATISKFRNTKTLLVDADLRRPRQDELFDLPKENGFADVLTQEVSLMSCFKDTGFPNLMLLTSGICHEAPTDIFNSSRLVDVFAEMEFYFDTIIVDTPPVVPVSDALVISPEMDGVLLVVRAGKTPKEVVKRATGLMHDVGTKIVGIVMNNMEDVLPFYYSHKYYGYDYYSEKNKGRK